MGKLAGTVIVFRELGYGVESVGKVLAGVTKAASDMTESINKVDVVFGSASASVQAFSQDSAKGLGLSRQAALEALGTFGNLFTSMEIGPQKSAQMSTALVKLASDIASFNNISVADALEKLQAGLVGEIRPLRDVGVNLTEETIKLKAVELGLAGVKDELTPAGKALAAYALIFEQTHNAQGDFIRTSDELANTTRIVAGQFEDLKASVGESLKPLALDGARALSTFFDTLKDDASFLSFKQGIADAGAGLGSFISDVQGLSQGAGLNAFDAVLTAIADRIGRTFGADAQRAFELFTGAAGDAASALNTFIQTQVVPAANEVRAFGAALLNAAVNGTSFAEAIGPAGVALDSLRAALQGINEHREVLVGLAGGTASLIALNTIIVPLAVNILRFAEAMNVLAGVFAFRGAAAGIAEIVGLLGGPLALALGATAVAVGVLAAAWVGDWGNIREKTTGVIREVQGAINDLGTSTSQFGDLVSKLDLARGLSLSVNVSAGGEGVASFFTQLNAEIQDGLELTHRNLQTGGLENFGNDILAEIEDGGRVVASGLPGFFTQLGAEIQDGFELTHRNLQTAGLEGFFRDIFAEIQNGFDLEVNNFRTSGFAQVFSEIVPEIQNGANIIGQVISTAPVLGGAINAAMSLANRATINWLDSLSTLDGKVRTVASLIPGLGTAMAALDQIRPGGAFRAWLDGIGAQADADKKSFDDAAEAARKLAIEMQPRSFGGEGFRFPVPTALNAGESQDDFAARVRAAVDANAQLDEIARNSRARDEATRQAAEAARRAENERQGATSRPPPPKEPKKEQETAVQGFMAELIRNASNFASQFGRDEFGKLGAELAGDLAEAVGSNIDAAGAAGHALGRDFDKIVIALQEAGIPNWREMGDTLAGLFSTAMISRLESDKQAAIAKLQEYTEILKQTTLLTPENFGAAFDLAGVAVRVGDQGKQVLDALDKQLKQGSAENIRTLGAAAQAMRVALVNDRGLDPEQAAAMGKRFMDALNQAIEQGGEEGRATLQAALQEINLDRATLTVGNTLAQKLKDSAEAFDESVRTGGEQAADQIQQAVDSLQEARNLRGARENVTLVQAQELDNVVVSLDRARVAWNDYFAGLHRGQQLAREDADLALSRMRQDEDIALRLKRQREDLGNRPSGPLSDVQRGFTYDPSYVDPRLAQATAMRRDIERAAQDLATSRSRQDTDIATQRARAASDLLRDRSERQETYNFERGLAKILQDFKLDQAHNLQVFEDEQADGALARTLARIEIAKEKQIAADKLVQDTKDFAANKAAIEELQRQQEATGVDKSPDIAQLTQRNQELQAEIDQLRHIAPTALPSGTAQLDELLNKARDKDRILAELAGKGLDKLPELIPQIPDFGGTSVPIPGGKPLTPQQIKDISEGRFTPETQDQRPLPLALTPSAAVGTAQTKSGITINLTYNQHGAIVGVPGGIQAVVDLMVHQVVTQIESDHLISGGVAG